MRSLDTILERFTARAPDIPLDHFQNKILDGLHLEFLLERCRVLFTPHMSYLTTGSATPAETAKVRGILQDNYPLLEQLKRYLLYSLSLYSGLLETNSYLIAVNDHLLISRFVATALGETTLAVKLYTLSQKDLLAHYDDKIYVGRDFIRLDAVGHDHLGIGLIAHSLRDQLDKLRSRLTRLLPIPELNRIGKESLQGLEENVEELAGLARQITDRYPADISAGSVSTDDLLAVNRLFREAKHLLIDMDETLRELEEDLLGGTTAHAARYVTMLRRDVGNHVTYIMVKVNGRITDSVNGFRV
jgi:hypothetical protein